MIEIETSPRPHPFVSLPLQSGLSPSANYIKSIFYKYKILQPSSTQEEENNKHRVM